ncbi:hypothetical protein KC640_03180, partial [Candidatus Dojkabacteria bacterium]|nr:hypothetical protein [Candidatus Dojkabacteria bacterium]
WTPKTAATCAAQAGPWTTSSWYTGTRTTLNIGSNLNPGVTYCWLVQKNNGTYARNSVRWQFTMANVSTAPTIDSAAFGVPANCGGARISGMLGNPNVNNPVTFTMRVSDSRGVSVFRNAYIAIVPTSGPTGESAALVANNILEPKLQNHVGFQISNLQDFSNAQYAAANNLALPVWGSQQSSGNLTNAANTSTLVGLNTTSTQVTQVDGDTLEIKFTIQFENSFITSDLNAYVMVAVDDGAGGLTSPDADAINDLVYRLADTWETDMQAPFVQVSTPVATGADTFDITWQANDTSTGNNGIRVASSTCSVTGGHVTLRDQTLGSNLNLTDTPTNCLVNQTNLGLHNYRILSASDYDQMDFVLTAEDGACNVSVHSSLADSPTPWIITANGISGARQGFTGFKLRNILDLSTAIPTLGDDAYLSSYSILTGNTDLPVSRASRFDLIAESYNDLNLISPQISGQNNWYDDLYKLVSDRYPAANISQIPGNLISFAGAVFVPPVEGDIYLFHVGGNLNANLADQVCPAKVVVFVEGTVTLSPNVIRGANAGCVIISRGDITVRRGSNKNLQPVPADTPLAYDTIEGFFITEGTFIVEDDPFEAHPVDKAADPLYIYGGVVADTVDLQRNVTLAYNGIQPSEAFEYNPYYAYIFRKVFAINEFSLRETK